MSCNAESTADSITVVETSQSPATILGSNQELESERPEKPASIRSHPEPGKEALTLLDLAAAALAELEKSVKYGAFTVQFDSEERARDLAKHARTLIETATSTPKTDLWLSNAFDSLWSREYIDLPDFFDQKRRGKRFFKLVLKQFKTRLNQMRRFCIDQLNAAEEDARQQLIRQVVNELNNL